MLLVMTKMVHSPAPEDDSNRAVMKAIPRCPKLKWIFCSFVLLYLCANNYNIANDFLDDIVSKSNISSSPEKEFTWNNTASDFFDDIVSKSNISSSQEKEFTRTPTICCTCEDATHCQNRRRKRPTRDLGPPQPVDFNGKLWYFTIGSASYIPLLENFRNNLVKVGVNATDIGIICVDRVCQDHFLSSKAELGRIEYYGMENITRDCHLNPNVTDMRCKVSGGKGHIVKTVLEEGNGIYFFDADVVFYQHPLNAIKVQNPYLPLYTQKENQYSNYGVVLAFPSTFTIHLFQYVFDRFQATALFDQGIFNDYLRNERKNIVANPTSDCRGICGNPYDYEFLNFFQVINLMKGKYVYPPTMRYDPMKSPVLAHGTCVEGVSLPVMSMTTMFGSPFREEYYLPKKTITVDVNFDLSEKQESELNHVMKWLVIVAKYTHRAIRIQPKRTRRGEIYSSSWYRLISTDYLMAKLGLDTVEDDYYSRATTWYGRPQPTIANLSIAATLTTTTVVNGTANDNDNNTTLLALNRMLSNDYSQHNDADEWVFLVEELLTLSSDVLGRLAGPSLGYQNNSWVRPFTCRNILKIRAECLKLCDGGHF